MRHLFTTLQPFSPQKNEFFLDTVSIRLGFSVVDVVFSGSFNAIWTTFTSYEDLVRDDFLGRDLCGFLKDGYNQFASLVWIAVFF